MTRVRSGNSRCGDLVRYVLGAASVSSGGTADKFYDAYSEDVNNIFLNFENCMPTSSEHYLFQVLERILENASHLFLDVSDYGNGATAHIKAALQNPDDEHIQRETFAVVSRFVARIKAYYDLALQIEEALPNLLWELCSGPLPPAEQIDASQALCKQLARVVDFVFRFDCAKMSTPAIQNDFSFYRRVLSRGSDFFRYYNTTNSVPLASNDCSTSALHSNLAGDEEHEDSAPTTESEPVVGLESATEISLFLASPTPMLNSLSKATVVFVREHPDLPVTNTTETLVTIVQICRHMLERKDFYERISAETRDFVLRVMVGALILFDHVDDLTQNVAGQNSGSNSSRGAFSRNSPIDLRSIVEVIRMDENEQRVEQLLNALRYTSKHFNDNDTPKSIKALFN